MSFELKTQLGPEGEEKEIIEETITKTQQTRKLWNKIQLQKRIAELDSQIIEAQERKTVLEEQLTRLK